MFGCRKVNDKRRFFSEAESGKKLLVSKKEISKKVRMDATSRAGQRRINLLNRNSFKVAVLSSVEKITKPLMIKKNWTPR
jgi:hypothetical protein